MYYRRIEHVIAGAAVIISILLAVLYHRLEEDVGRGELWVLTIFFLAIVFFILLRNLLTKNQDAFELINPFAVVFTLYTLILPINYLISPKYFDAAIVFQYLIIAIIGLISFVIGYYVNPAKNLALKLPKIQIEKGAFWIGAMILLLIGLVSFVIQIAAFGGIKAFFTMGYGSPRYLIMRQQITLGYGWDWIGLSIFLFLIAALLNKRYNFGYFFAICITCWIILSFWVGHRYPIMFLLTMIILLYNYLFRRIKLWPVLLSAIIFYIIFAAYGHTRVLLPKYGVLKALSEAMVFVFKKPELVMPLALGEFIAPAKSIIEILSFEAIRFKYGESYIVAFLMAIPGMSRIMSGELLNLSAWRAITFYPGLYERGAGMGFHVLAEGLINFGIFGVFIHMYLFGFFTKTIYEYLQSNSKNPFVTIIYVITAPFIIFGAIRNDLAPTFFRWTHAYLGPIVFVLLIAHLILKVTRRIEHNEN